MPQRRSPQLIYLSDGQEKSYLLLQGTRKLASIMFTDMVGYSSLSQRNERLAMELLEEQRGLLRPFFARYNGKEIKTIGDAFLLEFESALEAVNCSFEIQRHLQTLNSARPVERRILVRVGVHVGDVIHDKGDIYGDAVNIASRIEALAQPGSICVTAQVYDHVKNHVEFSFESIGKRELKNISEPIEIFRVVLPRESQGVRLNYEKTRIAVLPFSNISPDPSDGYFADGMTDELITTMSRISGLRVIARTSVMSYRDSEKKISEISKELEVGSILEGSVRKSGDKLRITVQLIDAQNSVHLWTESYDRQLRDVFEIQSDIAKTVADSLRVQLLSEEKKIIEKKQEVDPHGYALYMKGRFYLNERTKENVELAIKSFEQAAKVDPGLALAYSGLADCYNIMVDYDWIKLKKGGPMAQELSHKALEIEPNLAEAHASLALSLMKSSWDFAEATRELRKAIELRPNYAAAHHWLALLFCYIRRLDDALREENKALDIDPYSRVINMGVANILHWTGRTEEALKRFDLTLETNPDFAALHFWKSQLLSDIERYEEALEIASRGVEIDPSPQMKLQIAFVHAKAGRVPRAESVLSEVVKESHDQDILPGLVGRIKLALGQKEEGYDWLNRAVREKDPSVLMFGSLPSFSEYRKDPLWFNIDNMIGIEKHEIS